MELTAQLAAMEQAFAEKRLEDVKTQAEQFIAAAPQRMEGYLFASKAYLADQKPEDAKLYLFRAQEVEETNPEVLANLALISLTMGEVDSARHYSSQLLEQNPQSIFGLVGRADCSYAYEEFVYAIPDYQAALEAGAREKLPANEYEIVLYKAAHACLMSKQAELGLSLVEKYMPTVFSEPVHLIKRDLYRSIGASKTAEVRACTETLHKHLPNNYRYILELAEFAKTDGDTAKMDELYSKVIALAEVPEALKKEAYYGRARVRMEGGNYAGAVEDWDHLIAQESRPNYLEARAQAKEQLKDFKGALQDITLAIQGQDPEAISVDPFLFRGRLLMRGNAMEQAMADFMRVLKLEPNNADACYELGIAYNKQGDMNKSFKFLVDAEVNGHLKASEMLTTKFAKQLAMMRERASAGFQSEFQPQFARNEQSPILQQAFGKLWIPDMERVIIGMGDELFQFSKAIMTRVLDAISKEMFLITPQGFLFFEKPDTDPIEAYYKVEVESSHAILLEVQPSKGGERFSIRIAFYEGSLMLTYPVQDVEVQPKYMKAVSSLNDEQKNRLKTKKVEAKYLPAIEESIAKLTQ